MTYKEVLQAAQGQMGPCRACPVCNGRACGGTIPGPGAKGSGTVAVRNFDAWRNVRLNMDTIHENFEPDTSLTLFGRSFKYPFFAGPVGAMALHLSLIHISQFVCCLHPRGRDGGYVH